MPDTMVTINSICKTYKLYKSHRDRVKELIHPLRKCYHHDYHALKEINLKVDKGEIIGIIGQNGSGKSTLLKILTSIVTPTSGNFHCNGRISSILELGGGFNPELTGIQNVYFLGGLQGYKKSEMNNRIKKILDFADIGEYADQPVNNYSSGMYIRLAFSTAINIDPDILIIDEALAVGDIRFQSKCFRKLREFMNEGKTIIICTHNLNAVRDFCTRALWLHKGEIAEQGDVAFVTDCYNAFMTSGDRSLVISKQKQAGLQIPTTENFNSGLSEPLSIEWSSVENCDSFGTGEAKINRVALYKINTNKRATILYGGEFLRLFIETEAFNRIDNPGLSLVFNGKLGTPVFKINSYIYKQEVILKHGKPAVSAIDFQFPHIGNGQYTISLGIHNATQHQTTDIQWIHDAIIVEVSNPDQKYRMGSQIVLDNIKISEATSTHDNQTNQG